MLCPGEERPRGLLSSLLSLRTEQSPIPSDLLSFNQHSTPTVAFGGYTHVFCCTPPVASVFIPITLAFDTVLCTNSPDRRQVALLLPRDSSGSSALCGPSLPIGWKSKNGRYTELRDMMLFVNDKGLKMLTKDVGSMMIRWKWVRWCEVGREGERDGRRSHHSGEQWEGMTLALRTKRNRAAGHASRVRLGLIGQTSGWPMAEPTTRTALHYEG